MYTQNYLKRVSSRSNDALVIFVLISLNCAVAKVIQHLQKYGNSDILSKHTR